MDDFVKLAKIGEMLLGRIGITADVVNEDAQRVRDVIFEDGVHARLKNGSAIHNAERHTGVLVQAPW